YDVMMYSSRMLAKYGTSFQYYISAENDPYLQTSYKIFPNFGNGDTIDDRYSEVNYFENKHLDIIEYIQEAFVKLPIE
ncbi:MAG: hypothetical protein R3250_11010, partial [Melioribacteraceae bacterium]|nr:hypothetical protein [Melioribacteraceae bacterium]